MNASPFREKAVLSKISQAVTSDMPLQDILDLITTQISELLDAEAVLLFLSEDGGNRILRSSAGLDESMASALLSSEWLKSLKREPLLISDDVSAIDDLFADLISWEPRSLICVPFLLRDDSKGVLCVLDKRNGAMLDRDDLESAVLLADWFTIGLNNIRLVSDLQQTIDEKAEFVSLVAHELKVPMTSIKGYAKLLGLGTVGELSETQKQFLDTITRNVNRMDRLVSILLDVSRLDAGRIRLDMQLVSVKSLVGEVIQKSNERIQERTLTFEVKFSPDLPLIHADPARMVQILGSLLNNAILYTPDEGSISIFARFPASDFLLTQEETTQYVEIEICDNGVGIAEEDHPKVFNQFFRGDHPLVQEAAGSGFSLMVVKGLLDLHGGRIGFTSQLGQGSRFVLVVPVASADNKNKLSICKESTM